MRSSAARKPREDDAQLNVWSYIPPAPTGDLKRDLIAVMQDMAREKDAWGVTPGEAIERYERATGKRVGGEPRETKDKEQRQTAWLGRLGKLAGLVATKEVRPSPVKRHHGHRHTVYVHPSIRDVQR
jgi:hypothetical protein